MLLTNLVLNPASAVGPTLNNPPPNVRCRIMGNLHLVPRNTGNLLQTLASIVQAESWPAFCLTSLIAYENIPTVQGLSISSLFLNNTATYPWTIWLMGPPNAGLLASPAWISHLNVRESQYTSIAGAVSNSDLWASVDYTGDFLILPAGTSFLPTAIDVNYYDEVWNLTSTRIAVLWVTQFSIEEYYTYNEPGSGDEPPTVVLNNPQINLTLPEGAISVNSSCPDVVVNIPEQPVNVQIPDSAVVVNVPEQPVEVTVNVPEQPVSVQFPDSSVVVNVPEGAISVNTTAAGTGCCPNGLVLVIYGLSLLLLAEGETDKYNNLWYKLGGGGMIALGSSLIL